MRYFFREPFWVIVMAIFLVGQAKAYTSLYSPADYLLPIVVERPEQSGSRSVNEKKLQEGIERRVRANGWPYEEEPRAFYAFKISYEILAEGDESRRRSSTFRYQVPEFYSTWDRKGKMRTHVRTRTVSSTQRDSQHLKGYTFEVNGRVIDQDGRTILEAWRSVPWVVRPRASNSSSYRGIGGSESSSVTRRANSDAIESHQLDRAMDDLMGDLTAQLTRKVAAGEIARVSRVSRGGPSGREGVVPESIRCSSEAVVLLEACPETAEKIRAILVRGNQPRFTRAQTGERFWVLREAQNEPRGTFEMVRIK
ncbi:hypothetical protein HYW32_00060 [Candidatus Berkelbacteria bacterium]|nr:hypothetical protein [Candidatus Berkelbacteria bacterium]